MTGFARQRNQPASQEWMSDRASATNRDFMDMRSANELKALMGADQINNDRLRNNADQYFAFRDKSVEPWNTWSTPSRIPLGAPSADTGSGASTAGLFNQSVPTLDYLQPNFGDAFNILGQGASSANNWEALAGLVGAFGSIYDTETDPNRQVGNASTSAGNIQINDNYSNIYGRP